MTVTQMLRRPTLLHSFVIFDEPELNPRSMQLILDEDPGDPPSSVVAPTSQAHFAELRDSSCSQDIPLRKHHQEHQLSPEKEFSPAQLNRYLLGKIKMLVARSQPPKLSMDEEYVPTLDPSHEIGSTHYSSSRRQRLHCQG